MSKHDPAVALRHMLDAAVEASDFAATHAQKDAESDSLRWHGLIRLLEILGEAASRVPPDVRAQHPEMPWTGVIGMRNRLIHGYDTVNPDLVWGILTRELPPLIAILRRMLGDDHR